MIEVKDAVKKFDGFAALDGATLSVPTGSVYGLVGPNGAGKSTLIRHLTGIYRQDEGIVQIGGEDVWENAALKARIAAIPDDWYYFMQSTVRDMMRFYKGFYPSFSTERYEKLKEVFNIDEKRAIRRLSKGMQKQVAFWLALSCMPDYLILDEPVDGLDPVMRRQVWSLVMGDVAQRGTTVLVSSHNLRELEDVCDHVGIMDHGRVLLERSLAQLQDNMVKLQVVFRDGVNEVPPELPVLHASRVGRIHTLIMRMNAEEATERLSAYNPLLVDAVPLTLEEIFIYELGGADYAVKDIVLESDPVPQEPDPVLAAVGRRQLPGQPVPPGAAAAADAGLDGPDQPAGGDRGLLLRAVLRGPDPLSAVRHPLRHAGVELPL